MDRPGGGRHPAATRWGSRGHAYRRRSDQSRSGLMLNDVVDRGINVAVSRRLGIGPDATLSLLPELGINMVLPSEELLYHMGWRRYQKASSAAAVAAQAWHSRLRNPDGSGIIVIVDAVLLSTTGAAGMTIDYSPIVGATLDLGTIDTSGVGAVPRDNRQTIPTAFISSNAVISHETTTTPLANTGLQFRMGQNAPFLVPGGPWIVLPRTGAQFDSQQLNQDVSCTWFWRERPLNDQENVP